MKKLALMFAFLLSLTGWSAPVCCGETGDNGDVSALLPKGGDLAGWSQEGAPQAAEGEGLFDLIDGGAELYLKAGFKRAVLCSYQSPARKMINLEIYEMASDRSAHEVFRHKSGERGKAIAIGREAALEDHYLNFRKGRFQVTVSGYDASDETVQGLLALARIVEAKIR